MIPTYNGWEDTPEDEREALEQWEMESQPRRRSSQSIPRPDGDLYDGSRRRPSLF